MAMYAQGRDNVTRKTVFLYVLLGVSLFSLLTELSLCTAQLSSVTRPSGLTAWLFDACYLGCECHNWESQTTSDQRSGKDQLQDRFCFPIEEGTGHFYECGPSDHEQRFTVNCTHSVLHWRYQYRVDLSDEPNLTHDETELKIWYFPQSKVDFVDVVQSLPHNTTDLIVSNFSSLEVGMVLFQTFLHPHLFSFILEGCLDVVLLPNTFQSKLFKYIRSIYIHNNLLLEPRRFQEGMFRGLPFVEIISVVHNSFLEGVQSEAFEDLPKVRIINLTKNCLQEIQLGAFGNLQHLTTLDLSYNFLETIPGEDIIQLSRSSLKELYLEGNQWNCSCEMVWILVLNRYILADSQAVCYSPPELKGTPLWHLTSNDFQYCCRVQADLTPNDFQYCCTRVQADLTSMLIVSILVLATSGMCILCNIYRHYRCYMSKMFVGQIEIDTNGILGHNVFKGKLKDGRLVAVKKVPPLSFKRSKELDILLHMSKSALPHPNVIQYWIREETRAATYIALELCKGNLRNLLREAISRKDDNTLSQLTSRECLYQITNGLHYLHDCGIEHRDIKPSNILWNVNKFRKFRFIISDFDMGHFTEDQSSHKNFGSKGWRAPEFWTAGTRTSAVDIFSMGCVFFYVLSRGGHPFASPRNMVELQESLEEWQENIDNDRFSLDALFEHSDDNFRVELAKDLIGSMIHNEASRRPKVCNIIGHPLFWDSKQQQDFFHQIGIYMQNEEVSKCLVERLEQNRNEVFHGSWLDGLDTAVRNDLQGYKDVKTHLCTLLLVIRNKIEHILKLRGKLRKIYGDGPEGVLRYYNNHFPKLLAYTYRAWEEVGDQLPH